MEHGKILSKNILYAPLDAYNKVTANDDHDKKIGSIESLQSNYRKKKKSKEANLASFLHTVSCDYHRNRHRNDAKNNGSRPLGLADIEDRIRQRAVTILGGGINSSLFPALNSDGYNNNGKNINNKKQNRKRKRRRISWNGIESILKERKNNNSSNSDNVIVSSSVSSLISDENCHEGSNNSNDSSRNETIAFIQELNVAWNDYFWKVLPSNGFNNTDNYREFFQSFVQDLINVANCSTCTGGNKGTSTNRTNSNRKDGNGRKTKNSRNKKFVNSSSNYRRRPLELIGSHIRIESSRSHKSWRGKFGILIGETLNTYQIAGFFGNSSTAKSTIREKGGGGLRRRTGKKKKKMKKDLTKSEVLLVRTCCVTNKEEEMDEKEQEIRVVQLPKRGSSLELLVPIPSSSTANNTGNDDNDNDNARINNYYDKKEDGEGSNDIRRSKGISIIQLPDEFVCISIVDPE